jgi:hypothetical protein
MNCRILGIKGNWREVADAARTTVGKDAGEGEPSSSWKRRMLLAEHSPIRLLNISWKWTDLLSWVSVHFVRHKFGIEHFVRSQRTDRTGIDRDELKQSELITHQCEANAQAIINISRKRLCRKASRETRRAWKTFLASIQRDQPELYSVCVEDCLYRGYCYEMEPCGYYRSEHYQVALAEYRKGINEEANNEQRTVRRNMGSIRGQGNAIDD